MGFASLPSPMPLAAPSSVARSSLPSAVASRRHPPPLPHLAIPNAYRLSRSLPPLSASCYHLPPLYFVATRILLLSLPTISSAHCCTMICCSSCSRASTIPCYVFHCGIPWAGPPTYPLQLPSSVLLAWLVCVLSCCITCSYINYGALLPNKFLFSCNFVGIAEK